MTENEKKFIKRTMELATEFATLVYMLNENDNGGTAEKYGSLKTSKDGTIVLANISCSLQQSKNADLKTKVEPAVIKFNLGCWDSAIEIEGACYPEVQYEVDLGDTIVPKWKADWNTRIIHNDEVCDDK